MHVGQAHPGQGLDGQGMTEHSAQQVAALDGIREWFMKHRAYRWGDDERPPQVFRLFGYAGTGKTTMAKTIAAGKQRTMFAAYTGKAAQVLTRKGVPATTLHKLIYKPNGERVEYKRDKDGIIVLDEEGKPVPMPGVPPKPSFALDPESPLLWADLLVVDEVSMVNKPMGEDILSFGRPVLVLGDPAQLPPVEGGGFFTKDEPDALLTEVHRHAADSEVYRLATAIRNGVPIPKVAGVEYKTAIQFDQVIVGTNAMRWGLNEELRETMRRPEGVPVEGDKIIVLQNNYDLNVMNGETYTVISYKPKTGLATVRDDDGLIREMEVWKEGFTRAGEAELKQRPYGEQTDKVMATFAWAITCHKSQGSQWNNVLVVDESHVFRRDRQRWLYTAVTRAAEEVHVVNPSGLFHRQIKPRPGRR
jgi:exodeoxyribonuclease-5